MNIILIGPQGAGKGAQADLLQNGLGLVKLSTGDLIRSEIASGSELGKQIEGVFNSGQLVSDSVTISLVRQRLQDAAESGAAGAIFDGFPRNRDQAEALDELLRERGEQIDAVIELTVSPEMIVRRLAGRLVCQQCGRTYHAEFNPPEVAGICDSCGGVVAARADDTEEAIRRRLDTYEQSTAPLLDFYRRRSIVRAVDGEQSINRVQQELLGAIETVRQDS